MHDLQFETSLLIKKYGLDMVVEEVNCLLRDSSAEVVAESKIHNSERILMAYAYIWNDDKGQENIAVLSHDGEHVPVITHSLATIEKVRPLMIAWAKEHNRRVVLSRFSYREDLEVINEGSST